MQSRKQNTTQSNGLGSKSNPLGKIFQRTKQVGNTDLDLGTDNVEELIELAEMDGTEIVSFCHCGTTPLNVMYKNMPDVEDALNYAHHSSHDLVKRYYELKEKLK